MTPLTLGSASRNVPEDFPQLLELLGSRPQPAVVWYGSPGAQDSSEPERVELSGRVLQNWAVKLIGLFREELEEVFEGSAQPVVLVDSAPHWKAAAVILAAGALGAEVVVRGTGPEGAGQEGTGQEAAGQEDTGQEAAGPASLVVTDRPEAWQGSSALGEAELAALSPGLLDESFEAATGRSLPAWVLDISAEVRQQPDQLPAPLEPVGLPQSTGVGGQSTGAGAQHSASGTLLVTGAEWSAGVVGGLISAWARSGTVVLFEGGPEDPGWEQMRRNEGLD